MEKVSVIMSTYNESLDELEKSIFSILNQTYKNIEFIIVNDNPNNIELYNYLLQLNDERLKIIKNKTNLGLVKSLNLALKHASGEYIARMDADDISSFDRIEKQVKYLKSNALDMIGTDVQLIDEHDNVIQQLMHFPTTHRQICKYIKWGTCLPHPTWLVKKEVYVSLNGYREVKSCEDYDFIIRVLALKKYKLGNMPYVCLQYRIRENGISKSTEGEQYILRNYLAKNRKHILTISEEQIKNYTKTKFYLNELYRYENYKISKDKFKKYGNKMALFELILNKYFYKKRIENYNIKKREKKYKGKSFYE